LRTAVDQQHDSEPVPQPAVAHSRGQDHPQAHPPWSSPPVHPPHQPMIPPFDESPDGTRDSHGF
jgi:hypothetical protein